MRLHKLFVSFVTRTALFPLPPQRGRVWPPSRCRYSTRRSGSPPPPSPPSSSPGSPSTASPGPSSAHSSTGQMMYYILIFMISRISAVLCCVIRNPAVSIRNPGQHVNVMRLLLAAEIISWAILLLPRPPLDPTDTMELECAGRTCHYLR